MRDFQEDAEKRLDGAVCQFVVLSLLLVIGVVLPLLDYLGLVA
jgi:hypothetical protein